VWAGGCGVSGQMVDLQRPTDLPPLQELELHLDDVGPTATRPDGR